MRERGVSAIIKGMLGNAPLGVVDTLTEGFATLNKRLWLLLIPVILDLFLAFGPGISIAPFIDNTIAWLEESATTTGDPLPVAPEVYSGENSVLASRRDVNLVGVTWQTSSLVAATSAASLQKRMIAMEISDFGGLVTTTLLLGLVGLLFASFYLGGIAKAVKAEPLGTRFVSDTLLGWWRYVLLVATVLLLIVPIGIMAALIQSLAGVFSSGLGELVSTLIVMLGLAAFFCIRFADDAIFVAGVRPVKALAYSIEVIRRNVWPAIGLMVIIEVTLFGFRLAFQRLTDNPWGLLGGVVLYGYLATGFAVGSMIFFYQRLLLRQAETQAQSIVSRES